MLPIQGSHIGFDGGDSFLCSCQRLRLCRAIQTVTRIFGVIGMAGRWLLSRTVRQGINLLGKRGRGAGRKESKTSKSANPEGDERDAGAAQLKLSLKGCVSLPDLSQFVSDYNQFTDGNKR